MSPIATSKVAPAHEAAQSLEPSTGHVICAWCRTTLRPGDPSRPASHGVCPRCAARMLEGGDEHSPPPFVSRAAAKRR